MNIIFIILTYVATSLSLALAPLIKFSLGTWYNNANDTNLQCGIIMHSINTVIQFINLLIFIYSTKNNKDSDNYT